MKKLNKRSYICDVPAVATGDIAFNLLIFFLTCSSSIASSTGRKQELPKSDQQQKQTQKIQNIEMSLTAKDISINGKVVKLTDLVSELRQSLKDKKTPDEKVVVVRSAKDTPYEHWILCTSAVQDAGGSITLQLEEEQTVYK